MTLQEQQLKFTIANKAVFDKMHVSGLVKKSLASPKADSTVVDLIEVLVEKAGKGGDEKGVLWSFSFEICGVEKSEC